MTALEELRFRLNGAQSDLEKIESDFKKFVDLKDSIESADASLKTTSDNLASLATSFEKGARGLSDCVASLQSAATVLEKYDPIEIKNGQDRLEQNVEDLNRKIETILSDTHQIPAKIQETANAMTGHRAGLYTSTIVLLLLVLAGLGVSVWNLYLSHGAQILG